MLRVGDLHLTHKVFIVSVLEINMKQEIDIFNIPKKMITTVELVKKYDISKMKKEFIFQFKVKNGY
jgi:hypothetical protein